MGSIYLIINLINGTKYVGQTKNTVSYRYKQHIAEALNTDRNLRLYNAMRKYGVEHFKVVTLETGIPEEKLDDREIHYIKLFNTFHSGYNNTQGGGGVRGYHHSIETRKKMGIAISNSMWKINTPERTSKIIAAQKGRNFTEEHKRHISEACKGKRCGEDNPFYGKHHTEATKSVYSQCNTKYAVQQIDLVTGNVLNIFKNVPQAALYCQQQHYTEAKVSSIMYRLYYTCVGKQKHAYQFGWKYVERCND